MADSYVPPMPKLLHGEEIEVWGDQAYPGKTEPIPQRSPKAADHTATTDSGYSDVVCLEVRDVGTPKPVS